MQPPLPPPNNNGQPPPGDQDGTAAREPLPHEQNGDGYPVNAEQHDVRTEGPSASRDDRRVYPRRRKALRVLLSEAAQETEPFPGWIVDRSLGGMCLSVDHSIELGTILRLRRFSAPENAPWVELRVQSLRPQDESWELGCEFVRTPPYEVLMQFG